MSTIENEVEREGRDTNDETTWYGTWYRADGGRIEISGPKTGEIPIQRFLEEAVQTAIAFFGADGVRKLVDEDEGRKRLA